MLACLRALGTAAVVLAVVTVAVLVAVLPIGAQTVRPAVVEYSGSARGRFELVNETLFPMSVVLEPRGFRINESGELSEIPIDSARVRVKLSAMSFRLAPRQSYSVFYEADATDLPAWFLITSTMSGARTQSGLNVRVEPHQGQRERRELQPVHRERRGEHRNDGRQPDAVHAEHLELEPGRHPQRCHRPAARPHQPVRPHPGHVLGDAEPARDHAVTTSQR